MPDTTPTSHLAHLAESLRAVADYAADRGAEGAGTNHAANVAVYNWCLAEAATLDTDHAANVAVGRQLHRLADGLDPSDQQDMFSLGALARHLAAQATNHPDQLLGKDHGPTAEYRAPRAAAEHDDGSRP